MNIGVRLKHARLARGARLKDVAKAAGCSESLVSKLENNKLQPSLNVLHRLCEALDFTLGELFAATSGEDNVVSRDGHRTQVELAQVREGSGITLERLVPHAPGSLLQGNIHKVDVGGETHGLLKHQGEEVGYVLAGTVDLIVGEHTYRLNKGDSFFYKSDIPHGYKNVGDEEARIIFINTPPSF